MSELIRIASERQRQAAHPRTSVWVGANAGTGKTKVLTDRVLNLLLDGTDPRRILCLTFTRAAAAEMATRLSGKLSGWAVMADGDLDRELEALGIHDPAGVATEGRRAIARRLFARLLDVPGGMRIETIHAFCQALLRRFPLEAGISPQFSLLDDRDAADLMGEAREQVLQRARLSGGSPLAERLALLASAVHETKFPDLMASIASHRNRLRRLFAAHGGLDAVCHALRQRLGVADGETVDSFRAQLVEETCETTLRRIAQALGSHGGKSDQAAAATLAGWLAEEAPGRLQRWEDYVQCFLTKTGEVRKKFPTLAVGRAAPDVPELVEREALRLVEAREHQAALAVAAATEALLVVAESLLADYQARKERRGMLDFDDLIDLARRLLSDSEAAAWVLYKLDGGIDHVMIDEAQDTNADQWAVVGGLTGEFFSGEGAREAMLAARTGANGGEDVRGRTVFAVGDRKQSIYSFQGADPAAFEQMRQHYAAVVPAARQPFASVALEVSFRSVPAVLQLVDAVFRQPVAGDGVLLPGEEIHHLPFRAGMAGEVELWPPVPATAIEEPAPWKPPVDAITGESAQTRLARLLARRVAQMVGGEQLESRGRPVRPGDILVLVRRRGPFVEDLVRALKGEGIPVAGVDRMVLASQMAVMDLLALGEALLLPEDDLTLACVLKGPLIGLSEEELFAIAFGRASGRPRQVSLWRALRERAQEEGGSFRTAWETLRDLMQRADFLPPHELYAHILGPLRGRERLLARLGPDAADPLDEFVQLTLSYDRGHPPSLQAFLHWVRAADAEIKRDLDEAGNMVRVMTVHGSKGLQAPVVLLPDTRQQPSRVPPLLWDDGPDGKPLVFWPPRAADRDPLCAGLHAGAQSAQMEEYRRLLYVALTRAEDRLLVCGWDTQKAAPDGCWYNLVAEALRSLGREEDSSFLRREGPALGLENSTVWRLVTPQLVPAGAPAEQAAGPARLPPLPAWSRQRAPAEPTPSRPLAPSRSDLPDPPARSPLEGDGGAGGDGEAGGDAGSATRGGGLRFQRGVLIHRLLQGLPDLPEELRWPAALAWLEKPVWNLDSRQQEELAAETLAVLEHPQFSPLFGPGSRAEVPLTGVVGNHVVSGQVDRLLVTPSQVLVVDYKSNRPSPRQVEKVAPAYLQQMALYQAVIRQIYPDRPVSCALLWTDGPFLLPLPDEALQAALAGVPGAVLPGAVLPDAVLS